MRISDWSSDVCSSDLVITRLAKLRSLFVIAQGTVFALRDRRVSPEEVGRILNVDYVVSGSLSRRGKRIPVPTALPPPRTAPLVWPEVSDPTPDQPLPASDHPGTTTPPPTPPPPPPPPP